MDAYSKGVAYFCFFCLLSFVVVIFISAFITHADQPALPGSIVILFAIIIGGAVIGFLRLSAARKQGQRKHWYQQPEITGSAGFLCIIPMTITTGIYIANWQASNSRFIHLLELFPILIWGFPYIFFLKLSVKARKDEEKK